jgi:CheY-like chemotaxis protein
LQTHSRPLTYDEETVLEIASEMLAHLGYEAVCARDGGEAVELYS